MGYFLRRLSFYFVALLVAATLNFIIPRAMPGDPVTMMFANASVSSVAGLFFYNCIFLFPHGPRSEFLLLVCMVCNISCNVFHCFIDFSIFCQFKATGANE